MDILGWSIPLWLILLLMVILAWYWHATAEFGVFKQLGIPGPRPLPGMGTMLQLSRSPDGLLGYHHRLRKMYKSDVIGTFMGSKPTMVLFDVEAVKQIAVKDFNNFVNRMSLLDLGSPLNRMMTVLIDDHWRHVRHHVSPAFSGSKLRRMATLINRCGQNLVENLQITAKTGEEFECKEYTGSFTMDVIASSAFGIDIDSQRNKNNVFVRMAKKAMNTSLFSFRMIVIIAVPYLVPYLKKVGFTTFPTDCLDFFNDIVERAMKDRTEHPDETPIDFLQLMMRAEIDSNEDATEGDAKPPVEYNEDVSGKWSTSGLTKEDILAQCLLFFLAGYNTVADALAFAMYNLATHPEAQERAYQEIMDILKDKDEPDYDLVKKMTYLEMCIEESLRLYPPAPWVDRVAKSETVVNGIRIPKDMAVHIPIHALHIDPDIWDEPEKYNPERFTAEAKEGRHPFQYLPFGIGPRACVAQRLAELETKMGLVHILKNFKLLTCDKTQIPLKLKKSKVESEKGIWLKLEART